MSRPVDSQHKNKITRGKIVLHRSSQSTGPKAQGTCLLFVSGDMNTRAKQNTQRKKAVWCFSEGRLNLGLALQPELQAS